MGRAVVAALLTHLASESNVASSTHRQALSALLFLYREVLGIELPWMMEIGRPKRPQRPLGAPTAGEVLRTLSLMRGEHATLAKLATMFLSIACQPRERRSPNRETLA